MKPRQDTTPPPEITFLTQAVVRRLFAAITGTRDQALFSLAYHHGLRAPEVSLPQRQDIYAWQGRIHIPCVKGSISNMYPLQPEHLRAREDDSPALFISNRGMPFERRSSWDMMQTYGERSGMVKATRHFHALHHAIAVHLLDAGADVAFVQDRWGHANIQNTIVYMRYTTATRDAQTRQLFVSPRAV